MTFVDGVDYGKEHEFLATKLVKISATNVQNWMEKKAYGLVNPSVNNQPTNPRLVQHLRVYEDTKQDAKWLTKQSSTLTTTSLVYKSYMLKIQMQSY